MREPHREQLKVLCDQVPIAAAAPYLIGLLLVGVLWRSVAHGPLVAWYATLCAAVALRVVLARRARRALSTMTEPARWLRRFAAQSVITGAIWGGFGVMYLRSEDPFVFCTCILAIAGMCSGAMGSLSAYLPAAWTFLVTCLVPVLVVALVRFDALGGVLAVMLVVFAAAYVTFAREANRVLVESLRLRIAKDALVADLEQAVAAKSRFLAAASHDLRQPAHALGLYVGALRHRLAGDPAALQVVERIDASTRALDQLLDGILDISRLDAGAIEPELVALPLASIMRRVVDEQAEPAAEKGVELRLAPTDAWVTSDARMLERMLRNLVANAVRYTEKGKVLVGFHAGKLCVWDQGCGIAAEHLDAIFEEFRQLHNPERDRSRGLGLGLAIVRRIGNLLGHAVTVRSTVGRGSCFAIALPVCAPAVATVERSAATPSPDLTGVTVLVIDDERLAREAMAELVASWGGTALLAGSGDDALALAPAGQPIDAIVADYRLRDDETGYAAVSRVRAARGAQVPALIVTGDTAEERIREARATGLPLAHKPIPPDELRALIGSLLAR